MMGQTARRTDGWTLDRFIDPAPHTMQAVSIDALQSFDWRLFSGAQETLNLMLYLTENFYDHSVLIASTYASTHVYLANILVS